MVEGRWAGTVATGSVAGFISWSPAVCHSLLCSFQRCQFCLEASSPSTTSSAHASQTRHTFISLILLPIVFKDFIFPVLVASGLYTVSVILITIFIHLNSSLHIHSWWARVQQPFFVLSCTICCFLPSPDSKLTLLAAPPPRPLPHLLPSDLGQIVLANDIAVNSDLAVAPLPHGCQCR